MMDAAFAPPDAGRSERFQAARRRLAALAKLGGFTDVRPDRVPTALVIQPGRAGSATLSLTDRRGPEPRTYRLDADAEDLDARLAAIRGGERGLSVKVLLEPETCFVRTLTLPNTILPRMREVLAQELEAATPFRAEGVHGDWYVEGEDPEARTLRVRHVVIKRSRIDPLLDAIRRAGLVPGPVTVGSAEDAAMPVDLLTGGARPMPRLLRGTGPGDLGLLAVAGILMLVGLGLWRDQRMATLAALDEATGAARRATTPGPGPVLAAAGGAILAEAARRPPLAQAWSAVTDALPDGASAEGLRFDGDGLTLTLLIRDDTDPVPALAAVRGFAPARRIEPALTATAGPRRVVVRLPRLEAAR